MAFCFDDLGTGLALFWQTPITAAATEGGRGTVDRAAIDLWAVAAVVVARRRSRQQQE